LYAAKLLITLLIVIGVNLMREAQTMSQVLERLHRLGYVEDFKAYGQGMRVIPKNVMVDPEKLVVDEIYRFEGETDLNEEAMIFALRCPLTKLMGTYVVAFGPMMDSLDVGIVQRLSKNFNQKKLRSI
jgi:DNA-binding Lrp family transcriptional regulator